MSVISLTEDSFEKEVLQKDSGFVLVDFYAEWCSPCKMLAPVIEKIATNFKDQVKCGKVNIDNANNIAVEFNVASIPTLILFHNGEKKDSLMGVLPEAQIEDFLKKHI